MSASEFPISKEEIAKNKRRGTADIKATQEGVSKKLPLFDISGYLGWSALNGEWPLGIRIFYGSDLPSGDHEFEAASLLFLYKSEEGIDWSVQSGKLLLTVMRPEFGTSFKHSGTLENVTLKSGESTLLLNGTYVVESDQ